MADLRNTRLSIFLRNRLLSAHGLADFDAALMKIYTGAQPATPETAIGAQVLLDTITMANPAFTGSPAGGVDTADPTTGGLAVASGTAAWFRITNAAGTQVLADGSVGPAGDGNQYNLTLPTVVVVAGMNLNSSAFTLSIPMQGT